MIYGAINRKDWRIVSEKDIGFDTNEIMKELIPVLRTDEAELTLEPERWPPVLLKNAGKRFPSFYLTRKTSVNSLTESWNMGR